MKTLISLMLALFFSFSTTFGDTDRGLKLIVDLDMGFDDSAALLYLLNKPGQ